MRIFRLAVGEFPRRTKVEASSPAEAGEGLEFPRSHSRIQPWDTTSQREGCLQLLAVLPKKLSNVAVHTNSFSAD